MIMIDSCGTVHYSFEVTVMQALLVGRVFSMTTMSATLFPAIMVPFLNGPTWRTSSICCQGEYAALTSLFLQYYYL